MSDPQRLGEGSHGILEERDSGRGMGHWWVALRTVLYTFSVTGTMAIVLLVLAWLPHRERRFYRFSRVWARGLLRAAGVRLRVSHQAPLDSRRCYVFMPNHQSLFDIPTVIAALPGQARFMAKQSLFKIPLFGWALRSGGVISVDRQDRSRAREAFSFAIRGMEGGSSLVIFPEETRSPDGRILPFQRGGFLLALKSKLPIVPVGIRGIRAVCPKGSWRVMPGRVEINVGRPIAVESYGLRRKTELVSEVREQVRALAQAEASQDAALLT